MQILSKHITQSGGLSFVWEDQHRITITSFTADQVKKFLRDNIIIKEDGDQVWLRRRNTFGRIEIIQRTYEQCLFHQLNRPAFCEKILSTNTILK